MNLEEQLIAFMRLPAPSGYEQSMAEALDAAFATVV